MPNKIVNHLSKTRFFTELDHEQLNDIASQMRDQRFRSGERIFARGDKGEHVYLVMDGRVRLSVINSDGRELTFSHAQIGELFGEIAVLDGSPRSANAMAISDTHLKSLSRSQFKAIQQTYPQISTSIIELLCERMRGLSNHAEGISLFSIEIRLARYMLSELERQANSDSRIVFDITQSELGLLLGASRPKINFALSALQDSGAIRRDGNTIHCDKTLLEQASY